MMIDVNLSVASSRAGPHEPRAGDSGPMSDRLERAIAALDALHEQDPTKIEVDGETVAAELAYARWMSAALRELVGAPSEALALAVRAQHLCRWQMPRSDYPAGKAGYLRWRRDQGKEHAELARETLRAVGYDQPTLARVADLVRKKNLAGDPEAQAVEDCACLVFLEHHLDAFAEGRDDESLIDILQKTWRKMSEPGRALALRVPISDRARALLARALAE